MTSGQPSAEASLPPVPFERVSAILRQLSHDVRNELGALDLEAAYIAEASKEPSTAAEAKRLRNIVAEAAVKLKKLSAAVGPLSIQAHPISARMFVEEVRTRLSKTWPKEMAAAAWNLELGGETIVIDFEVMAAAFARIFENAFQFREDGLWIEFRAFGRDGKVIFEFVEGKKTVPSPPEKWGVEPFVTSRKDAYGLGLFYVRRVIGAHHGRMAASHDAVRGVLVTQVVLPEEKG